MNGEGKLYQALLFTISPNTNVRTLNKKWIADFRGKSVVEGRVVNICIRRVEWSIRLTVSR